MLKTKVGDVEIIEDSKEETKETARDEEEKIILFFDEINTNSNVSGILKEVLIDRTLMG